MTISFDRLVAAEEDNDDAMRREAGPPDSQEWADTFELDSDLYVPEPTIASALDSWEQAPDDVREEWADGQDAGAFECALREHAARLGLGTPLEALRSTHHSTV